MTGIIIRKPWLFILASTAGSIISYFLSGGLLRLDIPMFLMALWLTSFFCKEYRYNPKEVVEKLNIKDNDVLLIKKPINNPQELAQGLIKAKRKNVLVIFQDSDNQIKHLDEKTMRKHGWVKAKGQTRDY